MARTAGPAVPLRRADRQTLRLRLAHGEPVSPVEILAAPDPDEERVSIESLVAEAVAAEQPIEELVVAGPASAEPEPEDAAPPDASRPAPRKRLRLRRLGRR